MSVGLDYRAQRCLHRWTMTTSDDLGGVGQNLELVVLGLDPFGDLRVVVGDGRSMRFELLDANGTAVIPTDIQSIAVKVRRVTSTSAASLASVEDAATVDGVDYGWSVDLGQTVSVAGIWALEVDVVLADGTEATWPSTGPLRIRASEQVG